MIMKYEPELEDSVFDSESKQSQPKSPLHQLGSLARSTGMGGSWLRESASGTVQGAETLPTNVAALGYIDDRRQHKELLSIARGSTADFPGSTSRSAPTSSHGKRKKAKRAVDAVNDYFDRRARTRYAAENPGDVLNVPLLRSFRNRYLDPFHPATNRGLVGLLTGGALSPDPETRRRREHGRVDEEERQVIEQYHQQIDSIRNLNSFAREIERQLRRCGAIKNINLGWRCFTISEEKPMESRSILRRYVCLIHHR